MGSKGSSPAPPPTTTIDDSNDEMLLMMMSMMAQMAQTQYVPPVPEMPLPPERPPVITADKIDWSATMSELNEKAKATYREEQEKKHGRRQTIHAENEDQFSLLGGDDE